MKGLLDGEWVVAIVEGSGLGGDIDDGGLDDPGVNGGLAERLELVNCEEEAGGDLVGEGERRPGASLPECIVWKSW